MASEWFVKQGTKTIGPISNSELLEMVRSRKVKDTTPVRKGTSQWVAAITVTGLFQKAGVFTGDHRCPYCGGQISEPPSTCNKCNRRVDAKTNSNRTTDYNKRLHDNDNL